MVLINMSKREISIPANIEDLMQIYADYENSQKHKGSFDTPDVLQNSAYNSDPMTPFHKKYYYSKYRAVHYWLMLFCLILSIILYIMYFIGFYVVLNLSGFDVWTSFISRNIIFFLAFSYSMLISVLIPRFLLNKWNWKYPSMFIPLSIGIIFALVSFLNTDPESTESVVAALYSMCGISLGPAFLMIYLSYRNYSYITDYGGIHLHLGWLYRIAQTKGDLKVLNISISRLIEDLDMWLITTSKVTLKNKQKILEGFYLKVMSDRNFLGEFNQIFREDFDMIFRGLLVEDILHSDVFSHLKENDKKITKLSRTELGYLRYRLALTQLPGIMELIEKLTSTKVQIKIYSTKDKIMKLWSKVLAVIIFMISTLIPLILPLFQ